MPTPVTSAKAVQCQTAPFLTAEILRGTGLLFEESFIARDFDNLPLHLPLAHANVLLSTTGPIITLLGVLTNVHAGVLYCLCVRGIVDPEQGLPAGN